MALSRDDELGLIRRAQWGEAQALTWLVAAHRPRIRRLAERLRCRDIAVDDLEQEGLVAFIEAVYQFDPDRGAALRTYSQLRESGRMIEVCARRHGLSEAARRAYRQVADTSQRLYQELKRQPTDEEVAGASQVALAVVGELHLYWEGRAVPALEDVDDEEEMGERPAGVVLRHDRSRDDPQRQVPFWSACNEVLAILGVDAGFKWLVLWALREHDMMGYPWKDIRRFLAGDRSVAETWAHFCHEYPLPSLVPCDWNAVFAQFPPPTLTAPALCSWYSVKKGALREAWPVCEEVL